MKTMLLVVAAALSLATIGSAYADGNDVAVNTQFTEIPGVVAEAPVHNVPPVATAQSRQMIHTYVTQSNNLTWLYPPIHNYLGR
jgi:hypothetical protein